MECEPTIFLVEDDASVMAGVLRLFRSEGFRAETYSSAEEFLAREHVNGVCCMILDVSLPGRSGLELQEEMTRRGMAVPIIFITAYGDIPMTVRAMKGGASDFLTKPFDDRELLASVRNALEKSSTWQREQSAKEAMKLRFDSLSQRQGQVLKFVLGGMLNKQIALALGITEKTVKYHRGVLMKKLDASSLAGLVQMAEQAGIEPYREGSVTTRRDDV